jgi:2-polyprenyl-3-methyl-5-hydroxy-6-metoxy-1,4-benzoquinol methylase
MNRFPREVYDGIPWAQGGTVFFTKPPFEQIASLKRVPRQNRLPMYSEFYELQTYLDVLGDLSPGEMLDAGAGSGSLSYLFASLGWHVTACDYDRSAFLYRDGRFVQANLNEKLPFESGTFDAVVCKQVVEHLENPSHLIRESYRVLRSKGSVMISTPNIASLAGRFQFLKSGLLAYFENYWRDHRSIPHYGQLKSMLEEYCFEDVQFHTNRYEMYNMNARVNGKRMRYIATLLRLIARDDSPTPCKYGQYLMLSAKKR